MLKEMVRSYEDGIMTRLLDKVADGKARTPREIASITGMSWREVSGNFYNMSSDTGNIRHNYYNKGCRRTSRFVAVQKRYKIMRDKQTLIRKYIPIDENGQMDLDHSVVRKHYRTVYIVTRI